MKRGVNWWPLLIIGAAATVVSNTADSASTIPPAALKHRGDLIRNARVVWGLSAPVATFAAQVHQESVWRIDARSPYASGLAQFTPSTADWIAEKFPEELGERQPLNPSWALRALMRYDLYLWQRVSDHDSACDRMAFALSGYNGGEGWRKKRQQRSTASGSFRVTGKINPGVQPAFQQENEDYPVRILIRWQPVYASWGPAIDCAGVL
ncbi:MAG: transglycosylase SLT domain-containing protein [Burkholderiales bacterium]